MKTFRKQNLHISAMTFKYVNLTIAFKEDQFVLTKAASTDQIK